MSLCLMYKIGFWMKINEDFNGYRNPSETLCEQDNASDLLSMPLLNSPGIMILSIPAIGWRSFAKTLNRGPVIF